MSGRRRTLRFQYRSQCKFVTSRIGIIRLLCEPFTPAPVLLINRQVRMNSLENPDLQSLEFGRRCNQWAHFTSPFCNPSRNFPSDKQHGNAVPSSSSIGVPRGCLYLTSDRPPAPLPFPVPRRPCSYRQTRKDGTGGKGRHRLYPERGVLCATCVTVAGGYQHCGSRS